MKHLTFFSPKYLRFEQSRLQTKIYHCPPNHSRLSVSPWVCPHLKHYSYPPTMPTYALLYNGVSKSAGANTCQSGSPAGRDFLLPLGASISFLAMPEASTWRDLNKAALALTTAEGAPLLLCHPHHHCQTYCLLCSLLAP